MMHTIVEKQRHFFASGKTRDLAFRTKQLKKLERALLDHEQEILDALHRDLGKPAHEAYWSEIYYALQEISLAITNLPCWVKPQHVSTPWYLVPSRSFIVHEPRGTVVIFAPWNYPFQLSIVPLIGALAAGNCAIIKPSEYAPATSALLAKIVKALFDSAYITVVEGDAEKAASLLQEKFDYIFFTGSTAVGKKVMTAAAQHLTPLTLELGGQNPCIVTADVPLDITAQRIVRGKFSNMGQSCLAPNYLLVHASIKNDLVEHIKKYITGWYGDHEKNQRLVNEHHFNRVLTFLSDATILAGGVVDHSRRYISPTLLENLKPSHPVLHEEIFGPILPIITYHSLDEVQAFLATRPKPLALYLFSNNRQQQNQILAGTSSGGVCINDISLQFYNHALPFGGVGDSGFGAYHGKKSFLTFSHAKSVVKNSWAPSVKNLFMRGLNPWLKKIASWLLTLH